MIWEGPLGTVAVIGIRHGCHELQGDGAASLSPYTPLSSVYKSNFLNYFLHLNTRALKHAMTRHRNEGRPQHVPRVRCTSRFRWPGSQHFVNWGQIEEKNFLWKCFESHSELFLDSTTCCFTMLLVDPPPQTKIYLFKQKINVDNLLLQSWGWNLVDNHLLHNGDSQGNYPQLNNAPKYQVPPYFLYFVLGRPMQENANK